MEEENINLYMKGTFFSADFVTDADDNLRLLEINTDTGILTDYWHITTATYLQPARARPTLPRAARYRAPRAPTCWSFSSIEK